MRSLIALMLLVCWPTSSLWAACPPGTEFCKEDGGTADAQLPTGGGAHGCWDANLELDTCNTSPPAQCPPEPSPTFQFIDDLDGTNDGQLMVLNPSLQASCGTLRVTKTGYYRIYDIELSESCDTQLDETGYITIHNSCNNEGWAAEANVGQRFLVLDSDNTPQCTGDDECAADQVCRDGTNGGTCCVPAAPTFLGTFLLVADEDNKLCLHHWCPEWKTANEGGDDLGFVTAGCDGINSIHFRVGEKAIACEEDTMLYACTFGCQASQCLPDPCDTMNCPKYCKDGQCLDDDPCAALNCAFGCKNGRCLQATTTPGVDADGDGYPHAADCDDETPLINPGANEVCGNQRDDDCDGQVDESDCSGAKGLDGGSGAADSGSGPGTATDDGCSCRVGPASGTPLLLLLLALFWHRRRRR
ncbi:MAG: putative metal-binding motif-containing protein [Deltaproteobacteria bacterium]|nr:putative metal-binding motif-containing protein [Deltaproteobacteria bacterium]